MSRIIELKTPVPGPRSQALLARRQQAVPRTVSQVTPVAVAQADNAVLTDVDGNRLIDFGSGIGVLNAGHRNARVVAAVREQLEHFTHLCFQISMYEPYIALAERLNAITPGGHSKRTMFTNSGAEAVDNAVKVARRATGRQAVVCFEHAFHGRTYMGMSLTSKAVPYKSGYGPFMPEVYRLPFPYCYRCDGGPVEGRCCMADRAAFERLFASHVDPTTVAAIILELEVGEGGFIPAPRPFVAMLAQFAKDHGILLIADEIQSGFGRTGALFACEHYDLVPDLIITAKSLAGGLPLAALTGRAEVMDTGNVGGLGGTYGGNPLACAAALAVLDAMEQDQLVARARTVGETIRSRFLQWQQRYPEIGDVRGLGAMVAMELVKDPATREPHKELVTKMTGEALKRGLLLLTAGTFGNVIRVLVPLTVEEAVLQEGLGVMEEALTAAVGR
ncbi:MAG: 4-aminobutyrate--2-oxoglutarate transaminase [Gemmatimonadales bacterium]|nr:4-aminobutyrate--2-oxoglutarate transaminase [Gemmatimonadales bacterium]MBP9199564.1 4-aminobutyrate--2-oxoglutarate transaminase [Gemmatimonadales bacterium]